MGIRFFCPNGHKMNVKEFQAGRRGICPECGVKMTIPTKSTRKSSKELRSEREKVGVSVASEGGEPQLREPPPQAGDIDDSDGQVLEEAGPDAAQAPSRDPAAAHQSTATQPDAQPHAAPWERTSGEQPATAPAGHGPSQAPVTAPSAPPPPDSVASPPDPLDEAPMAVWYVRPPSGGQFGPARGDVMRAWLAEYRVSPDSLVWREGWPDWRTASEVFPQLGGSGISGTSGGGSGVGAVKPHGRRRARPRSRRMDSTTQALIITGLVLTVLVLGLVFAWVVL